MRKIREELSPSNVGLDHNAPHLFCVSQVCLHLLNQFIQECDYKRPQGRGKDQIIALFFFQNYIVLLNSSYFTL